MAYKELRTGRLTRKALPMTILALFVVSAGLFVHVQRVAADVSPRGLRGRPGIVMTPAPPTKDADPALPTETDQEPAEDVAPRPKRVVTAGRIFSYCPRVLPMLPTTFWGTVSIDGEDAPNGTVVSAWIDDVQIAKASVFVSNRGPIYSLDIPADDPDTPKREGGNEGDVIIFRIDGELADVRDTWHSGMAINLHLNVERP